MMRNRLPREWKLPSNAFRHRLSSQLRTLGCPGIYVEALLGHVELGIQPFGRESFMDPAAFLDETGRCIQTLMEQDGWKPLYGLATAERSTWEPRPLGSWVIPLHAKHIDTIEKLRAANREAVDRFRELAWDDVSKTVLAAISATVPDFFTQTYGRLDKEQARTIRRALTENASSLAEAQITVEIIRATFTRAREERGWKIARMPFFYRGPVEASPFSPTFPCAYETFLRLRALFVDAVNGKSTAMRQLSPEARLVLALILWHGVADWSRLETILAHLHHGRHIRGLGDAIAIPYEIPGQQDAVETVEILRGAVAMAAIPYVSAGQPIVMVKRTLGNQLARCIPSWVTLESGEKLIDILLSAAQIAHLFEHASPLRDVWSGNITSVSAPFARIERLFAPEAIPGTCIDSPSSQTSGEDGTRATSDQRRPSGNVLSEYKGLRPILRIRRGHAKRLPHSKTDLPLSTPDPTVRREILRELRQHSERCKDATSVSGLLTSYAQDLLTAGTFSSSRIELQTVYNYVVGAGCSLVRVHPDADLLTMEAEDLVPLYCDAIDAAPKRYQPFMARYLSYFHGYLVRERDASFVDLRAFGGQLIGLPDVGLVAPREYARARELLTSPAQDESIGSVLACEQAAHVLDLGYATGARSGELVLRECRELVAEPDRPLLHIRANRMTSVKTKRATRVISLDGWLSAEQLDVVHGLAVSNDARMPNHALFPDQEDPMQPVDPDLIARHIGKALRAATGEPRARQYWLRHMAASMEFLSLFADEFLLGALKNNAPDQVPFPFGATASQFAQRIGSHTALSPIHAAAYRARRGHASIGTSLTTYVHTIALIEPKPSREAALTLTHEGFAALIGRSPASVRQVLHRATTSITDPAAVRDVLISASLTSPSTAQQPDAGAIIEMAGTQGLRLTSISRGIECYLRTGNSDEAVRRMKVTARTQKIVLDILRSLPFRPHLRASEVQAKSSASLLEPLPATERPSFLVSPRSINPKLLKRAFNRMRLQGRRQFSVDAELWDLLLTGVDPDRGIYRIRNIRDLELLASKVLDALGIDRNRKDSDVDMGEIVLVVDVETTDAMIDRDLRDHAFLQTYPVIRRNVSKVLAGYLPVALAYRSSGGRDRTMSLLHLAIVWRVWRSLFPPRARSETQDPGVV